VLLVLAAGFIGQFGKRRADHLLSRRRRKAQAVGRSLVSGTKGAPTPDAAAPSTPAPDAAVHGAQMVTPAAAKAAKKAAKAEVKRLKKLGPPKKD